MNKPDLIVGVDAGKRTGVSFYRRSTRKLESCHTMTFWGVIDLITNNFKPGDIEIVIENPSLKRLYARHAEVGNEQVRNNISNKAGGVRRESELLIERFQALGYLVRAVPPVHAKKWDQETFQRFTGWPHRVSQHVRDASRLVVGL